MIIIYILLGALALGLLITYLDALLACNLVWIMLIVIVVLIAVATIVINCQDKQLTKKSKESRKQETENNDRYLKSIDSKISELENKIIELENEYEVLTPSELSSVFEKKNNGFVNISDKEIEDLFIWLAFYKPSKSEYEGCWLYDLYKDHVALYEEVNKLMHLPPSEIVSMGSSVLGEKLSNTFKAHLVVHEILMTYKPTTFKNELIFNVVLLGGMNYFKKSAKAVPSDDVIKIANEKINAIMNNPCWNPSNEEDIEFVNLVKQALKSLDDFKEVRFKTARTKTTLETQQAGEYDVVLVSAGEKKLHVVKIIRDTLRIGLQEAKDIVEYAPETIVKNVSKEDAYKIKAALEEVGATVEIK